MSSVIALEDIVCCSLWTLFLDFKLIRPIKTIFLLLKNLLNKCLCFCLHSNSASLKGFYSVKFLIFALTKELNICGEIKSLFGINLRGG